MKVLVIGGGGREHALVWKLREGAGVQTIWCAPGNGGIAADAECVPVDPGDVTALMAFVLFGERLDGTAMAGMIACAAAVFLVNRRARSEAVS